MVSKPEPRLQQSLGAQQMSSIFKSALSLAFPITPIQLLIIPSAVKQISSADAFPASALKSVALTKAHAAGVILFVDARSAICCWPSGP